jgi:hypothetical protein
MRLRALSGGPAAPITLETLTTRPNAAQADAVPPAASTHPITVLGDDRRDLHGLAAGESRVEQLGRGYEYMDLDLDAQPDASTGGGRAASVVASEHGAETPGCAGTAHKGGAGHSPRLTTRFEIMFGGGRTPTVAPNVLISAVGAPRQRD